MAELSLWFAKSQSGICELERTLFIGNPAHAEIIAVRGKTAGAYKNVGTFQWTPGVKALVLVFLTAVLRYLQQSKTFLPLLEGERGSLASSLDYAVNKQPEWVFDMFGADENSNAYLRQLLLRSNTGRRRSGPVSISLNETLLQPQSINVYVGGTSIKDANELEQLIKAIVNSEMEQNAELTESNKSLDLYRSSHSANLLSGTVIVPVSQEDIHDIYQYEQEQFPRSHGTKERLLEWSRHDPNNYVCIKESDGAFLAYYLIMFLKPDSMKRYLQGSLSEIDISSDDLLEPRPEVYAKQHIVHICVFAARTHASIFTFDLLWHLIGRLSDLIMSGSLSTIYAEIATKDGKMLVERFGFKFVRHKPPEGLLYELKLTPDIIREWEWRYKLRTFCKTPISSLQIR